MTEQVPDDVVRLAEETLRREAVRREARGILQAGDRQVIAPQRHLHPVEDPDAE